MMYECKVCGETDENVELLFGGVFGYAHEECTKHADRIIDAFLEYAVTVQGGAVFLARELIDAHYRVHAPPKKNKDLFEIWKTRIPLREEDIEE